MRAPNFGRNTTAPPTPPSPGARGQAGRAFDRARPRELHRARRRWASKTQGGQGRTNNDAAHRQ
eukprot:7052646-Pyramimonas_sp.AAC.1